jgi:predicted nuclease of predicted toxin-antitoxin system
MTFSTLLSQISEGLPTTSFWAKAAEEKRVIITRDLDYPSVGLSPAPFGVMLIRVPSNFRADQITNIFEKSIKKLDVELIENKVVVISPGKIRISPLP